MSWQATGYVKELTCDITAAEKLVMFVLSDYIHPESNIAWPSMPRLAELSLMSERHCRRCLNSLEKKNLISRVLSNGGKQTNRYSFTFFSQGGQYVPSKKAGRTPKAAREDMGVREGGHTGSRNKEELERTRKNLYTGDVDLFGNPIVNEEQEDNETIIKNAFEWFCENADKTPAYTLTDKRKAMARSRLAEALKIAEGKIPEAKLMLFHAMDGLLKNEFMQQKGLLEWEQVFRSQENFQKWIDRRDTQKAATQ